MTDDRPPTAVGVVGVGAMGENHARVYRGLPDANLVGVHDADDARADDVAARYDARSMGLGELCSTVDAVSVAVPTQYHYETVRQCFDAGVDVLVEKPFVRDCEAGRTLVEMADDRNCTLQIGHVERFNPAVQALLEMVPDLDPIAVSANRLSPPVDRNVDDSAVMDLMIHDLDVLLTLVDGEVTDLGGVGTDGGRYAAATVEFDSGVVGQLAASRVTQETVRELTISARDCRVTVDYIDQSLSISRKSIPEYVRTNSSVEYHQERIVEEVTVEDGEPLAHQLDSFLSACRGDHPPVVDGRDGIRAVEVAQAIEREMGERSRTATPTPR